MAVNHIILKKKRLRKYVHRNLHWVVELELMMVSDKRVIINLAQEVDRPEFSQQRLYDP